MPYPSPPRAESDLALLLAQQRRVEEVMEKLQQVNQSLGLMLATMEDARSQLEIHLQHLHADLNPAGELGMGAGGWMGAGGCQRQALAPCPAGWSPSAISTCILHGSYFVLLVALLVPMLPRAILLLFFLASSTLGELLGIPALSAFLALAVAGGDGSGGTPEWAHAALGVLRGWAGGCSALSHPLASLQGSGWWQPPAAVLGEPGWCFPARTPITGSPPPRIGRRWLGEDGNVRGTLGNW